MSKRPTVTLCMIVKDEEHIITECLESIYKHIDRYDITDTGSTDSTKEKIREFFEEKGIPGEVHEMEWLGFGKSRTQSLENAAKSGMDYAWVIDADDRLEGNFKYPKEMTADSYALNIKRGEFNWWRNQIFKLSSGWRYCGVLHEYAECKGKADKGEQPLTLRLKGDYNIDARTMGARTQEFGEDQAAKYTKDAETLIDCLENAENPNYEPDNLRYMFYVAQSYFDAQNYEKAMEWYEKRATKGGWDEEVWYCVYRVAICKCLLNKPWEQAQDHFLQAWNLRPHRAEPLYQLSRIHRQNNNPRIAYLFAKQAASIPFPEGDILFLAHDIYDWMCLDELAATAYYANDMMNGLEASNRLLEEKKFPKEHEERIVGNFQQYAQWLTKQEEARMAMEQEQLKREAEEKLKRSKKPEPRRKKAKSK
jgi:glycosyltransferase involved in cell wall biosynthesis